MQGTGIDPSQVDKYNMQLQPQFMQKSKMHEMSPDGKLPSFNGNNLAQVAMLAQANSDIAQAAISNGFRTPNRINQKAIDNLDLSNKMT